MKKCKFVLLLLSILCCLTGCRTVQDKATEITEKKEYINYTKEQMALLILSKMEEIDLAFGHQIWEKTLDANGLTYESEFLNEMHDFFIELKSLNMIAKEKGVQLTAEEESKVGKLAGDFYNHLSSNPNFDAKITHEEVDSIFKEYALANKTKVEITKAEVDSISEDDARILNLQQIVLNGEEELAKVKEELQNEKADFFTIARQNSKVSAINIEVGHEDMVPEVDKIVCELENGEVSEAILVDGKYYIYKCIEGYNTEATAKKKKEMKTMAMEESVKNIYLEYQSRNKLSMDSQVWEETTKEVQTKLDKLKSNPSHVLFFTSYRDAFDFTQF